MDGRGWLVIVFCEAVSVASYGGGSVPLARLAVVKCRSP